MRQAIGLDMWQPTNSKISPYLRHNLNALLRITGGTNSQNFRNAVNASNFTTTMKYTPSAAEVYKLKNPRFVLKSFNFFDHDQDDLKVFFNELKIGSLPGIQAVSPKIYAFKLIREPKYDTIIQGQFVMDNIEQLGTVDSLNEYSKKFFNYNCPPLNHPIYSKIRETLEKFWKITCGYHGHLHPNNIAIIHNNGDVKHVRILNYGTHKKFKQPISNSTCFNDFLKIIDKTFNNKYIKHCELTRNPKYSTKTKKFETLKRVNVLSGTQIKSIILKRGNVIHSNTQMLKGLNAHGSVAHSNRAVNRRLLTHLLNTSKKRKLSNNNSLANTFKKIKLSNSTSSVNNTSSNSAKRTKYT